MTALPPGLEQAFEVEKKWLENWRYEMDNVADTNFLPAEVREFAEYWSNYLKILIDYHNDAIGESCEEMKDEYTASRAELVNIHNGLNPGGNDYLKSLKDQIELEKDAADYILPILQGHCS